MLKLAVNRISELSETALFRIKRGMSFKGTVPSMLYLNTAYVIVSTNIRAVSVKILLRNCADLFMASDPNSNVIVGGTFQIVYFIYTSL